MRRRGMLVLLLVCAPSLEAQRDVSVRSYLDRQTVGVNQQFVLSVEISGANVRLTANPELPDVTAFSAYLGSSSSQSIQIANGRTTVSTVLQYRFQATAEGDYEIGAVELELAGSRYRTDPLSISIAGATAAAQPRQPPPAPVGGAGVPGDPSELFLRARVNKNRVYENEPVIVEYRIYTRVRVSSYGITRAPQTSGFWAEEFPLPQSPETSVETLNGVQYTVATIKKTALFPTGPGERTIDPMTIETQVRVRSRDPFDDFFSGSLLGRTVPRLLTSDPLTIQVEPLPSVGRPPAFTGLVGDLDVSAAVDKVSAETDGAVSLRLQIRGEGNLRVLPDPQLDFPSDFEVYAPEREETIDRRGNVIMGTREYEYVLIPRAPGEKVIPPLVLSFFDSVGRRYKTVATDSIRIVVTGDPVLAPVTAARGRGAVEPLRADIRYIHTDMPSFSRADRTLLTAPLFWLVMVLPMAAVSGAFAFRRHQDRLVTDVAYARDRRASRIAKQRLRVARANLTSDTSQAFHAEIAKALLGFLGDKLNVAEAGLMREEVRGHLRRRDVDVETTERYLACLDVCDRQQFAPSAPTLVDMRAFLARVEQAMMSLDRALK